MNTIQVYIWGVRYGFTEGTALFPERNRLTDASEIQHYDTICRNFTQAKDAAFRTRQKDFYFLMQDHQYQIYSLVDKSHQDKGERDTYLVFSIVCTKSNIIVGSIKEALQNLKILYKTRNSDPTVRTNMFTNDQVRNAISNLTLSTGQARSLRNNAIFYFQNEAELNLNDYTGHEVYFMHTGGDPEFSSSHLNLSIQQLSLGQVNQQIQQNTQSLAEFKNYLNTKTNLTRANELYTSVSSQLTIGERTEFENWRHSAKGQTALIELKQLIAAYTQNNATDIGTCESILAQYPQITNGLTAEEQKVLSAWQNQVASRKLASEKNEIDEIEREIEKAAKYNYEIPITSVENRLKNNQLDTRLSADAKNKLKIWREKLTSSDVQKEIHQYYTLVKQSDRRTILNKQKEWLNKIDGWPSRLKGQSPFDEDTQKKYKYLLEKTWVKKDKPFAKIATMAVLAFVLTGGGFFAAMNWSTWFSQVAEGPVNPDPKVQDPNTAGGNQKKNADTTKYTDFTYLGKVYRVEKSLLTENGSKYNNNSTFYRFLNNKWEMRAEDASSPWRVARPADISPILVNWDKKFKAEEAKKKENSKKEEPKKEEPKKEEPKKEEPKKEEPKKEDPKKEGGVGDEEYFNTVKAAVKNYECDRNCIQGNKSLSGKQKVTLLGIFDLLPAKKPN